MIRPAVSTIGMRQASYAAALLLTGGAKGRRFATPGCSVVLRDAWIAPTRPSEPGLAKTTATIHEILARHTGQPLERVTSDLRKGLFLTADEAVSYGLVDTIAEKPPS